MSEDLLRQLQLLEKEYTNQPLVVQQADLVEINRLRAQLKKPLVDAKLKELGAVEKAKPTEKPKPKEVRDHTEARKIYEDYLKKAAELEVHQAYADRVAKATSAPSQTPVRPLATMGTNGGPLLCDQCGKPIVLEGGQFHGKTADVAWRKKSGNWNSWILGGMVVEIQTNGTLRIYHGYPGMDNKYCCNVASREDKKAREKFESSKRPDKQKILLAFFEDEFPEMTEAERYSLLSKIVNVMFSYDPGIGVNRPSTES